MPKSERLLARTDRRFVPFRKAYVVLSHPGMAIPGEQAADTLICLPQSLSADLEFSTVLGECCLEQIERCRDFVQQRWMHLPDLLRARAGGLGPDLFSVSSE